jgi:polysaccharide biosynthesis transport protein
LHRYSTQMSANLRVVDAPVLPDTPKPSKRASLIIMGFMAGFVLPLVGLIIMDLLDKSIRTPETAIEKTDLDILSSLPKLPHNWEKNNTIDFKATMQKATNQLIQNIKVELRNKHNQLCASPHIAIVGTRGGEGKSFIKNYLEKYKTGFQFTELPALLSEHYSADLDTPFDLILVVVNADFTWNNADKKAIAAISKVTNCTCYMVLNNVRIDNLESSLGEIPKRRSAFRVWFKKMLSLNLAKS